MTHGFFLGGVMLNRFSGVCRFCILIVSALGFLLLNVPSGFSADIKLAWDPNTESDLAGYKVYYGTSPRTGTDPKNCGLCGYVFVVPVGNIVTYVASNLMGGQAYYFSVTASDLSQNESGFSNEVSGTAGFSAQPYTFATNPAGLQITVDGTTYTAPQTFNWSPNSSHTLSVASPQGGTGTRYLFSSWSDVGAQNHMITVPSSGTTYTANFSAQYSLTTLVSPLGVGAVSPSGVNWYNSGQSVPVSGSPNTGYSFSSWTGDLTGSSNPASLTMGGPKSVTANFTQNQYTLAVSVNPSGSGSVTKSPSKSTYVYGEQVTLTATANAGYSFGSWSGDASGTTSPTTVTINGNKTVSATFTAIPETVSTPTTPTGSGTGVTGTSYSYSTGGSSSNLSHSVQYQFDWKGDGSDLSAWGGANQSKTWVTGGAYQVKARARCMSDTGVVSGWSSGLSVSISQATVSCTVATTPTGLQVTVDGTTYTTPQTFGWVPGSSHTVSIPSPQSGGAGTQYVYSSWSDGGGQSHTVAVPPSNITYTANFATQYSLTMLVSPSGAGTVSPSGVNWYNSGQSVPVSASPNGGYSFLSWAGDLTGPTNPASLTMGAPKSVTANFGSSGSLVVTPSTGLTASGTQGGPFNPSSQNYILENKGSVAIGWSALKTQNWTALSLTGGILGPGATATVSVSINSNANGLAVGSFGDTITFENTTNGSGNTSRVVGLTVNAAPQTYTVSSNLSGLQVYVDDTAYSTPRSFQWVPGSSHKLYAPSPQKPTQSSRYNFLSWSDSGAQTHTINAPGTGTTYEAKYKTQNKIRVTVSPTDAGTVSLSGSKQPQSGATSTALSTEDWYDDDDTVTLTASANSGYNFSGWAGDLSGKDNSVKTQMNNPKDVVANFVVATETVSTPNLPSGPGSGGAGTSYSYATGGAVSSQGHAVEYQFDWKGDGTDLSPWGAATQSKTWGTVGAYQVKARARCLSDPAVVSNWSGGLSVVVTQSGVSCTVATNPSGLQITVDGSNYTAPQIFNWAPGSSHTVSAATTLSGGPGTQYVYLSWSDGGGQSHTVTVPSSNTTYTANFTVQYSLTTSVTPSGGGTVSPSGTDWYNSGQSAPISASAGAGYSFSGWTGDLSGAANPTSLTMSGPKSVTANFSALSANLVVTPVTGLSASGLQGGPFSPASQVFTVQNNGGTGGNWSVSKSQDWLSLSSSGGALAPGMSASLTVAFNASANTLAPGTYTDAITFKDQGGGNTIGIRSVALVVSSAQSGYTVTSDPPGLFVIVDGMTYRAPCTFDWPSGSSHALSVSSLPQPGFSGTQYVFGRWNDGGSQSHVVTASPSTRIYLASFDTQHSFTLFASPPEGGKTNPSGTTWFNAGERVSLSASTNEGYSFAGWSGDVSGNQSPTPVLMDKAKLVTANFSAGTSSLTANAVPLTSGSISKSPDKVTYTTGEQVTLTAIPNPGCAFKNWSGDLGGRQVP